MKRASKNLKYVLLSFMCGIGVGHVLWLLLSPFHQLIELTLPQLLNVAIVSGLVGVLSYVLFALVDRAPYIVMTLHVFFVGGAVLLLDVLNGWTNGVTLSEHVRMLIVPFVISYTLVWWLVRYATHQQVGHINRKIQEQKKWRAHNK